MKLANNVPHPIPYQGSKRILADAILAQMPPRFSRLVEPFAGSAAISLAVAHRRMASEFWLNDAHRPVADLWRAIIGTPDELADAYARLWSDQLGRERAYFDVVRDSFNKSQRPADFLYLLARCVKAAIRYNADGHFNNTPDNRRKGAKPAEMRSRILGAAALLSEAAEITSLDYRDVLDRCTGDDVVYMDPPYQGVCASQTRDSRYAPKVGRDDFCEALERLNGRNVRYLVSYDGRCGEKQYGAPLPAELRLVHMELRAGRSTQATLLGRNDVTYESLYLSPALAAGASSPRRGTRTRQRSVAQRAAVNRLR